jgi:hypothetical protein
MKFLHQSAFSAHNRAYSEARFIYEVGNGADAAAEAAERAAEQAEAVSLLEASLRDMILELGTGNIPTESPVYIRNNQLMLVANGFRRDQTILTLPTSQRPGPGQVQEVNESAILETYGVSLENLEVRLNAIAETSGERGELGGGVNSGPLGEPELGDNSGALADPEAGVNSGPLGAPAPEVDTASPEALAEAVDVAAINGALPDDIEERVVSVEYDAMGGGVYTVFLDNGEQPQIEATGINSNETLRAAILESLGMFDSEVAEVAAEAVAPTAQAIMEAYGQNGNKGAILTQVNEAMGYVRGTPDRITSIHGGTQARLVANAALRVAFGEALGLTTAAPAAAPAAVVAEADAEPAEVDEAPDAGVDAAPVVTGVEMEAEQAQALIDSLDGLTGMALQARINELATQLGLTFPAGRYIENGLLKLDGSVGGTTRNALKQIIEALERNIPQEADHYLSVLDNLDNPTDVDSIIEAIRGNQVLTRLLQRDLRLLGFYNGGIDGVFGAGSRRGLEAALTDNRFETLYDMESAAREAEVVAEGERHGRRNPSVDALIAKIKSGAEITAEDVAFTGSDTGGMADRTREVMDFIEQAVSDGEIDQSQASVIVELMMREEMYNEALPQTEVIAQTLEDADGRFLPGLASVNPDSRIREISPALVRRVNNDRAQLIEDMHASTEVHTFGPVNADNPMVEIDGQEFDMRTLTKMYILTGGGNTAQGSGAVEMPIGEMTTALQLHNLVYRDGALMGTMENGCEGNLVIIPVERQYVPMPPPVVRTRRPEEPQRGTPERHPEVDPNPEPVPEGPGRTCKIRERCQSGRVQTRQQCWNTGGGLFNLDQSFTPWTNTGEFCHEGGDGGGDNDGCGGCGSGAATGGDGNASGGLG